MPPAWSGRRAAYAGPHARSGDRCVKTFKEFPDDIAKRSADLLASAKIFAFDASDLMPTAMNAAFWTAILDYTKDPSKLDSILQSLDKVQTDAYAAG